MLTAVRIAVETWNFIQCRQQSFMIRGNFNNLHHNIEKCQWRGPDEGHDLRCCGRNEQSGGLYRRVHARCLRLKAEL